ncbi:MAG: hypothetical protein GXY83_24490 [Rhodopirellula sp.]|nr:hypothetical protein [Rhodopirellula sp.]
MFAFREFRRRVCVAGDEARIADGADAAGVGLVEGRKAGLLIGQVRLCEELLACAPRAEAELTAMSLDGLRQLADRLRTELRQRRPTDSPE